MCVGFLKFYHFASVKFLEKTACWAVFLRFGFAPHHGKTEISQRNLSKLLGTWYDGGGNGRGYPMTITEHYASDVLFFFDGKPMELSLYQTLLERMEAVFPAASVKVQKSQISFYNKHLFAAASLPARRRKDWPNACIIVTIGLSYRLTSSRVAVAVEPYPNRWTHHVLVSQAEQIDDELLGWLREAYDFAERKR